MGFPDRGLTALLERHLDGPPASWAERDWAVLAELVKTEGVWTGDDATVRAAVARHALLLGLVRSGIPGLTAVHAATLADRMGSPARLATADDAEVAEALPDLAGDTVHRIREAFTRSG